MAFTLSPVTLDSTDAQSVGKLPSVVCSSQLSPGPFRLPRIFIGDDGPSAYSHTMSGGVLVSGDAYIVGDPLILMSMSGGLLVSGDASVSFSNPSPIEITMLGGVQVSGSATVDSSWVEFYPSGGVIVGGAATYPQVADGDTALNVSSGASASVILGATAGSAVLSVSAAYYLSAFPCVADSSMASSSASITALVATIPADSRLSASSASAAQGVFLLSAASFASIMDGVQFVADFTDGWAYNLNTGAGSFYEGFKFNSFAMIDGEYYGANESGIFLLGGDADGSTPIAMTVTTGTSSLGSPLRKMIAAAHVGAQSDAPLILTCRVDGLEFSYPFSRATTEMGPASVRVGRGLSGVYWQFELSNTDGAYAEIDALDFLVSDSQSRRR